MEYTLDHVLPFEGVINDLAFSPDGTLLAVATRARTSSTVVYQVSDWSLRPAPRFVRYSLAFASDGSLVVAGVNVERFALTAPKLGRSAFVIPGQKKGITTVALSPDGRWLAVHKYLEALELWFVGDGPAVMGPSFSVGSDLRFFFRADSAGFWFFSSDYAFGRRIETLRQVTLGPNGASEVNKPQPMPEGLGIHDRVQATPHGLAAVTFPAQDVVIYDWDSREPRALGVKALQEQGFRGDCSVSPDGEFLVVQVHSREGNARSLVVVALPGGEEIATIPVGSVGVGLLRVAPGAERIAFIRVDGTREVQVLRRTSGVSR